MAATMVNRVVARRSGKLIPSIPSWKVIPMVSAHDIFSINEKPIWEGLNHNQRNPVNTNNVVVNPIPRILAIFGLYLPIV